MNLILQAAKWSSFISAREDKGFNSSGKFQFNKKVHVDINGSVKSVSISFKKGPSDELSGALDR